MELENIIEPSFGHMGKRKVDLVGTVWQICYTKPETERKLNQFKSVSKADQTGGWENGGISYLDCGG